MLLFVWETVVVGLPGIILKLIVHPRDFVFFLTGVAVALQLAINDLFHADRKMCPALSLFLRVHSWSLCVLERRQA